MDAVIHLQILPIIRASVIIAAQFPREIIKRGGVRKIQDDRLMGARGISAL